MYRNTAIEHELGISNGSWADITPMDVISKSQPDQRGTAGTLSERGLAGRALQNSTMSYNANMNVSWYAFREILRQVPTMNAGRPLPTWNTDVDTRPVGYNRINVRNNLDFTLTKTTTFKMNIAGSSATRKTPRGTIRR